MSKKNDDGKVKGVKSTSSTSEVDKAQHVDSVKGVKATSTIGAIGGVGAVGTRRATRTMTLEEREQLFKLIDDEAGKVFAHSGLSKEKRELVQNAVKMAVDSGLLEKKDSEDSKKTSDDKKK
jgi:hypothetical protein